MDERDPDSLPEPLRPARQRPKWSWYDVLRWIDFAFVTALVAFLGYGIVARAVADCFRATP